MSDKNIHPCRLCSRWPSHAKPWIHALNCARSVIVKFPITCLLGLAAPKIQIGFVPDLEVPLRNFIDAVAIDEMFRKRADEVIPFAPVLGRRNVRPVPENVQEILSS